VGRRDLTQKAETESLAKKFAGLFDIFKNGKVLGIQNW